MIKDLLTIIIPCKDAMEGTKKSIEDLLSKSKIKGTSVLVLDFGSTDGSYQYVQQASSYHIKTLRIESIKMEEGDNIGNILDSIQTPYIMVIKPGSISNDNDFVLKAVNRTNSKSDALVYIRANNVIDKIVSTIKKSRREISYVISHKSILPEVKFVEDSCDIIVDKSYTTRKGLLLAGFSDN